MTHQEFDNYQIKLLTQVNRMKDTKGKEYSNSENRFANFDRLAAELGLTNIQVAWVYTKNTWMELQVTAAQRKYSLNQLRVELWMQ